jgi:MoaA/NifB/PqqE/SkfB family radical SAM enzyme
MKSYSKISFDVKNNKFSASKVNGSYEIKGPLSVGFQITRRCNLNCIYCSEPNIGQKELSLAEIEYIMHNLSKGGTKVVKLTGGEPLLRKDVFEIIEIVKNFGMHVAMDTNSTLIDNKIAKYLSENLIYVETTLDGMENMHNRIRGNYNQVLKGINNLSKYDIDILLATIVLDDCIENIKSVIDFSKNYNIRTLKIMSPIPKGLGENLPLEYLNNQLIIANWEVLCDYKERVNPNLKIILLDWNKIGAGSVILIHPDGQVAGSPSIGEKGCVTPLGNLMNESIIDMWNNYKHKSNHIHKCLEQSIFWR